MCFNFVAVFALSLVTAVLALWMAIGGGGGTVVRNIRCQLPKVDYNIPGTGTFGSFVLNVRGSTI